MKKRITIEERPNRREICESQMRYAVMLDGKEFGELYYNMRGYQGYLPSPRADGSIGNLDIGERPISAFRKEVAELNRRLAQ